jgi:hypothetical protein
MDAIPALYRTKALHWGDDLVSLTIETAVDEALAKIGPPTSAVIETATKLLVEMLVRGEKWIERNSAAKALRTLNWSPETQEEGIALLIAHEDFGGLIALGAVAVPALIWMMSYRNLGVYYDGAEKICAAARDGVVTIGASAVPVLVRALKDQDYEIRQAAAQALGRIKDKGSVRPLLDALAVLPAGVREESPIATDFKRHVIEAIESITGKDSEYSREAMAMNPRRADDTTLAL